MTRRTVLVTGGTRGIGRAIATAFVAVSENVIVCARGKPEEPLTEGAAFIACDVADRAAVQRMFAEIEAAHERLDILVNNAGAAGANPLAPDADDGLWDLILATNLYGTYYCSKAALGIMPAGSGRIVNIASVLALRGVPDQTAYCAAKHGVLGFTRALAHAVGPRGITVNAVCPGWVDTEMARRRFAELGLSTAEAAAGSPLGRISDPAEVAALVLFLCSPAARNITGQAIGIDGGWLA